MASPIAIGYRAMLSPFLQSLIVLNDWISRMTGSLDCVKWALLHGDYAVPNTLRFIIVVVESAYQVVEKVRLFRVWNKWVI